MPYPNCANELRLNCVYFISRPDPMLFAYFCTLEVFELKEGRWTVIGLFQESDQVSVAPFTEITFHLGDFWLDDEQ